jgi:D-alanyl-D-alanine endopeptidase (penicillin-binding protein 7)
VPPLQRLVRGFVRILRRHPHTAAVLTVALVAGVLLRVTDSTATAGPRPQAAAAAALQATPVAVPASPVALAVPSLRADVLRAGPATPAPVAALAAVQLHGTDANPFLTVVPGGAEPVADAAESDIVARTFNALLGEPDLKSASVLIMDPHTGRPLYAKNDRDVLPIASITKLMTALVVLESGAPMGEVIEITKDDLDRLKSSRRCCGSPSWPRRIAPRLPSHARIPAASLRSSPR